MTNEHRIEVTGLRNEDSSSSYAWSNASGARIDNSSAGTVTVLLTLIKTGEYDPQTGTTDNWQVVTYSFDSLGNRTATMSNGQTAGPPGSGGPPEDISFEQTDEWLDHAVASGSGTNVTQSNTLQHTRHTTNTTGAQSTTVSEPLMDMTLVTNGGPETASESPGTVTSAGSTLTLNADFIGSDFGDALTSPPASDGLNEPPIAQNAQSAAGLANSYSTSASTFGWFGDVIDTVGNAANGLVNRFGQLPAEAKKVVYQAATVVSGFMFGGGSSGGSSVGINNVTAIADRQGTIIYGIEDFPITEDEKAELRWRLTKTKFKGGIFKLMANSEAHNYRDAGIRVEKEDKLQARYRTQQAAEDAQQFQQAAAAHPQAATVVPPAETAPAEPPADPNAGTAAQGEYHDLTGDLVGVIVGEDVVRNEIAIDESDVEQYDNSHPDADEPEWDAFYEGYADGYAGNTSATDGGPDPEDPLAAAYLAGFVLGVCDAALAGINEDFDILDWLYGGRGEEGVFDVDNFFHDAIAEQIQDLLGDEFLVNASDGELIGLTAVVATAATLGGWAGGAVAGTSAWSVAIIGGAAGGASEYLAWTIGANIIDDSANDATLGGLTTHTMIGAAGGGVFRLGTVAGRGALGAAGRHLFGPGGRLFNQGKRASELADPALLDKLRQRGFTIDQSPDIQQYLDYRDANAATFLNDDLLLRPDARKIEVLEEYLHNIQRKIGLSDKMGVGELEIHVKEFMLRHRGMLRINDGDAQWLRNWLNNALGQ